jgi:RNA polymerase sigma factor (sigma-70 family)
MARQSQLRRGRQISATRAETLTLRQEQALVLAARRGDAVASRRLVEVFMPAILGLAFGFPTGAGVEVQELRQQGVVGLLFATRRFDPRLNKPFWAYASFWVRKAMQELVADSTRPVALSDRAVRSLARVRTARREYLQAHRAEPTNEDLSAATGMTAAQVESLQATERLPRGLHEPLRDTAFAGGTVADAIVDPVAEEAFEHVLEEIEVDELRGVAGRLDDRERAVVGAHYGLGQTARTLDEIGDALGVTAERARQIEAGALTKLREALRA